MNRKLFPEKSPKELLDQFKESGSQEPFEEIVRRYAAMVYGVCLRVTGDKHDAEDATQAVFLSLALQAKTSREIIYVGPWLQKVAHRLALDVKKAKTRRKKREEKLADQVRHSNGNGNGHHHANGNGNGNGHVNGNGFFGGNAHLNPADAPQNEELKKILMEELDKLPAKYRMPLVLHYFGGLSREQMAAELGCNPSTLGVRVHRGKGMLGRRLAKRGVAISAIALTVVLEHVIRSTTMQPLISASSTASAAACVFASSSLPTGETILASAKVIALTRTIARSLVYAKLKVTLGIVLLVMSAAVTTGSVVAKYVDLSNLSLPSLKIGDWIRPLLKSLTPSPLADAKPTKVEDQPLATNTAPSRPAYNLNQLTSPVTVPAPALPPLAASRTQSPPPAASASAQPAPPPQFTLVQPLASTASAPIKDEPIKILQTHPVGTAETTDANARAEEDTSKPVLADATSTDNGDFNIGAGGGGGFGGKPEVYVMPQNATLRSNNQTIGDTGSAVFRQVSGNNVVAATLTLGKQKGSTGIYEMTGGTLTAKKEIIGDAGEGAFIQARGVNIAQDSIVVGNSGSGSYIQSGDSKTLVLNPNPTQDPALDHNGLHLAQGKTSTATYCLTENASLSADPQIIAAAGNATFNQSGGTNSTGAIAIATEQGSTGQYNLEQGDLVVKPRETAKPEAAISIGGKGKGSFNLGDANSTGKIYEVGAGGSSVVIRGQPRGDGSLLGWGKVNLTGGLSNNSQVIADGYRKERTLDLSSFNWITSTIENPRWGGDSGWFARRKGKLLLPAVPVKAGNGTYTWGEDAGDPMIDLVNSVRFEIKGAQQDGDVSIALLSTLRGDIPELPTGHKFIGVWSFDGSDLGGFDSIELNVRYDDSMADTLALDENILKLWYYGQSDQQWHRIVDSSFMRNTIDHLLTGDASPDLSYFAVSAPEPTGATLLLIATGVASLRRRRRNQSA